MAVSGAGGVGLNIVVGARLVGANTDRRDRSRSHPPPRAFLSKQQRMTRCIYGSVRPAEHLPRLLEWAAEGTIAIDRDPIARRIGLDELEDAFDQAADGGVRTVVSFE